MRVSRLLQPTLLLALSLVLVVPCLAQAPADKPLTNTDVGKMLRAGLSENIVIRVIQVSNTHLDTGAAALIELKNQGASEGVLDAVLDSRTNAGRADRELPPANYSARTAKSGSFRLPSLQADLRLKSKDEKFAMGNDHISIVQAGVPIFSVKWKVKRPDNSK